MKNITAYLPNLKWLLWISIGLSSLACSDRQENSQAFSIAATPDLVPQDLTSVEAQLQRFPGQQSFLNISSLVQSWHWLEAADGAAVAERLIEQADLFKLGSAGSQLLYVLNPYRGLQVIDFSAGPDHARLLARTEATGHEPLEMYFLEQNQQIIIIERAYRDSYGHWLEQATSQILVYSVKKPKQPSLVQKIALSADVADSRRVGDVLYLTTSVWPSYQDRNQGKGRIISYQLTARGLREIASLDLNLPVRSRESLQVISQEQDGHTRYYVTLSLSESRFGFSDRQSTIEVIDISDPQGRMQRLLQVSSKGVITQRSAVSIKDQTLIVVSNFWQDFANGEILRVAVEGFRLPRADSTRISLDEANFRAAWLEREMRRLGIDLETAKKQGLLAHPDFGLAGVFVSTAPDHLSKWVADSAAFTGDGTGLHAQIQDVRFVEDLLYVFWVPQSQIDPLDVFDISQPDQDIRFLQRSYFDGWIERSIPLFYDGRHFILGLGWIIPADAASPERQAQLMLFEVIKNTNGKLETKILEQLTLQGSKVWANWSESDQTITVKFTDQGRGSVLFPYYQWDDDIRQGGKLVGFDLAAGLSGSAPFLAEGALLSVPLSWLRRVFSNNEMDLLHILTDRALVSYETPDLSTAASPQIQSAVQILELARDLRAYGIIENEQDQFGVQILASEQSWQLADAKTEIRLVPRDAADASREQIISSYQIPGRFKQMSIHGSILYVLTLHTEEVQDGDSQNWQDHWNLHRLQLSSDESAELLSGLQLSWLRSEQGFSNLASHFLPHPMNEEDSHFLSVPGQALMVVTDGEIRKISQPGEVFSLALQKLDSCLEANAQQRRFHILNQGLSMSYEIPVKSPAHLDSLQLVRSYIIELDLASEAVLCGPARNIPGRPLLQPDKASLVVSEQRFLAWENLDQNSMISPKNTAIGYPSAHSAAVLISLELTSNHSRLVDLYGDEGSKGKKLAHGQHILLIEQSVSYGTHYLSRLSLDTNRHFQRQSWLIPDSFGDQSLNLFASIEARQLGDLLVLRKQQSIIVYALDFTQAELNALDLQKLNADQSLSLASKRVPIRHYYHNDQDQRFSFDPVTTTMVLAEGLWGATQIRIPALDR